MKKYLFLFGLVISNTLHANLSDDEKIKMAQSFSRECTGLSNYAKDVMIARQTSKISKEQLLKDASKKPNEFVGSYEIKEILIKSAFDQPVVSENNNQKNIVEKFQANTYMTCMQMLINDANIN